MHVLLSSASTPRYRYDILRCISSPLQSTIQFRYSLEHCHISSLDVFKNDETSTNDHDAIICFADIGFDAEVVPLTPIRRAKIVNIVFHGSTISLTLQLFEFVDIHTGYFTSYVSNFAVDVQPKKLLDKVQGSFLFE